MKVVFSLMFLGILLFMSACGCKEVPSTPDPPTSVRGWQEFDEQGIHAIGEFLLRKGESVENDKFGVELVKTIVPKRCSDAWAENDINPRALIRFYEVPGKRVIHEIEVRKGSSLRLPNSDVPITKYGIDTISVREINTRDEWVWFELWK